jgi:hypothetical protein
MRPCLRRPAAAIAVLLAGGVTRAQTTNAPGAEPADDAVWSVSASANVYILPDSRDYVQPSASANRGRLHLEARYNSENLETGSAWLGFTFNGGKRVEWEITPMLGGVFGETTGIAPGMKGAITWRQLELYSENEYVIDAGDRSDSFFYNWSEATLAPSERYRFGVVTQRTRVYRSDREIQRGVMAGVSVNQLNITAYVFNPDDEKPRFVLGAEWTF